MLWGKDFTWGSFSESSGFICKQMTVTFPDTPPPPRVTEKPAKLVLAQERKRKKDMNSPKMKSSWDL